MDCKKPDMASFFFLSFFFLPSFFMPDASFSLYLAKTRHKTTHTHTRARARAHKILIHGSLNFSHIESFHI